MTYTKETYDCFSTTINGIFIMCFISFFSRLFRSILLKCEHPPQWHLCLLECLASPRWHPGLHPHKCILVQALPDCYHLKLVGLGSSHTSCPDFAPVVLAQIFLCHILKFHAKDRDLVQEELEVLSNRYII